ncbi:SpoIIE family protein phosphatase [Streptomyces sp. NPDC058872]|uniref:SpoIIE family protein phosphatase n=1 Tax=Streptomyces sp. NPDC058872 TaxID=3346661 RepID=UPI0036AD0DD9
MNVLDLSARSVEGVLAATAVTALVDPRSRLIAYSSAGRSPPFLLYPDRTFELLDQATEPPLGARPEHVPRSQAGTSYRPGDTLVLYTDDLVERHDEDIDAGPALLTDALTAFGSVRARSTSRRLG